MRWSDNGTPECQGAALEMVAEMEKEVVEGMLVTARIYYDTSLGATESSEHLQHTSICRTKSLQSDEDQLEHRITCTGTHSRTNSGNNPKLEVL
jgi:hypothetical protein